MPGTALLEVLREALPRNAGAVSAYQLARRLSLPAKDIGRALLALEEAGDILSLGEGRDDPLAELYVRAEQSRTA